MVREIRHGPLGAFPNHPPPLINTHHAHSFGLRPSRRAGFQSADLQTPLSRARAADDRAPVGALAAEFLRAQHARFENKATQLNGLVGYLRAKVTWLEKGSKGGTECRGRRAQRR